MSARWSGCGDLRRAQQVLYHTSPPPSSSHELERHNLGQHERAPKGGKGARSFRKVSATTYFPAAMSAAGVRTPTTGLIGYIDTAPQETNHVHDPDLVSENLRVRKIKSGEVTEDISRQVRKYGSKSPDLGLEDTGVATKVGGNKKLHIKRTFSKPKRMKVRLIRSDRISKPAPAVGEATRTQEVRIRKHEVHTRDVVETRRIKRYDSQTRKITLVEPVATTAFNIECQTEARTFPVVLEGSMDTNIEGRNQEQRHPLLSPDMRPEALLPYRTSIRDELQAWQEKQGPAIPTKPSSIEKSQSEPGSLQNLITRSHGANRVDEPTVTEGDASDTREQSGVFMDDGEFVEKIDDDMYLEPGDMVELSAGGNVILAIYIQTLRRQAQFYTVEGQWCHRFLRGIWWADRHFVDASEVASILPYLPSTEIAVEEMNELHSLGMEVPRDVGAKLIDKMNVFMRASLEVYRAHADRIDHAFDIMADEKHLTYVTLTNIASKVLQISDISKISKPALFAVHRACMEGDIGFGVESRNHWANGEYEIMSQRDITVVRQVREWLRDHQEELTKRVDPNDRQIMSNRSPDLGAPKAGYGARLVADFVKKARQIVMNSRQFRPLTNSGSIGPSRIRLQPQKPAFLGDPGGAAIKHVVLGSFTEQESVLLKFLEIWTARRCLRLSSPLSAMGPMLLRATGLYEDFNLDQRTGFTFLQEMGVFAPWENRVSYSTRLALPGYHFDAHADELQANVNESLKNWTPKDSMKHLRKDWGDLEVFCVDSVTAQEIDDGFSLEKIEGNDSQFWIHVHIANPTAFFSPEHPLSKYAAQLTETLYLPEKIYSMLNLKITQRYFSLGRNRPALTFSSRINRNGEILETKITPSMVHNVKYFSPETIARELASKDTVFASINRLVVGPNPVPSTTSKQNSGRHMSNTLDDSQRETLKTLKELGAARRRKREANGAANFLSRDLDASVYFMEPTQPYRRVIRRIDGDPTIVVAARDFDPAPKDDQSLGDSLVSELMLLTCEMAALWTSSRGIPVLYRGTKERSDLPSPSEYKRLILDPLVGPNGIAPFLMMKEYMSLVGHAYASIDPVHHQMIGIDAYTKATSPLRRYGDMVTHWQIEAALRHEAETGKSLVGTTDHRCLPFSRDRIATLIPFISKREPIISHAKRNAQLHWVMQALFRAFYFKEGNLPKTWEVYIWAGDSINFERMQGLTKELCLEVSLQDNKISTAEGGIDRGDWWEARIEYVDIYMRQVVMAPLRLIERAAPEMLTDATAGLSLEGPGRRRLGNMRSPL
ncbi:hypothetical protein MMC18_001380 [Xylographa bjoerkii]|nr:hypothetical protein [Xylographa bjoerkii]